MKQEGNLANSSKKQQAQNTIYKIKDPKTSFKHS